MNQLKRARRVPNTEIRLRLLCLMDCLGYATREQLWVLVARLDFMEYIPYCEQLQKLCESGLLCAPNGLSGILALTAQGCALLSTLMRQMPRSERLLMEHAAQAYRRELDESQNCSVYHEAPSDGLCCVRCRVCDNGEELAELWVRSADAAVTNRVAALFRERAAQVLRKLYLLPRKEKALTRPVLSGEAALEMARQNPGVPGCTLDSGRYSGVIHLPCKAYANSGVIIRLWENDRSAASLFADAAAECGSQLADEVVALLCEKGGADGQ